jgi:transposase
VVKKEDFLELCKTDPEEVFKLFCIMGETITTLQSQVVALNAQVDTLKAEVKELKARLGQNSKNSNKPPSSDEFFKPKSTRKKSGKKSGGQKGHPGHTLKMSDNPDRIIVHRESNCSDCGCSLAGQPVRNKERRQSFDVPVPQKEITEHISESICCPDCGKLNKAQFPPEITQPVQYGPGLLAQLVYLSQYQLIPYNRVVEFVHDIYGLNLSEATVYKAIKTAFDNLEPVEEIIVEQLKASPVLNTDETGLRVENKRQWLHVASTDILTHYQWHPKRGSKATDAIGILPNYDGTIIHDYWKSYYKYSCAHSLCNVHNIRELTGIFELTKQQWAQEMIDLLLEIKAKVDELKLKRRSLSAAEIEAFKKRYDQLVTAGYLVNPPPKPVKKRGRPKQGKARNMLRRLSEHRHEVLAFMEDYRIDFDNNQAERDLRMVKVKQKISGVFRSTTGADMFCRIRGYISTARKNSVSAFSAITGVFHGKPFIPEL